MMKVKTIQIAWHNRNGGKNDPILSCDFHPQLPLLATGGGDNDVKVWEVVNEAIAPEAAAPEPAPTDSKEPAPSASAAGPPRPMPRCPVKFKVELQAHQAAVNVVRWSPDGRYLASASVDSTAMVWRVTEPGKTWKSIQERRELLPTLLRGHTLDVSDVAWSPCSRFLLTCSVDNMVFVWRVDTGAEVARVKAHSHFIQGVSWDPLGTFIASLGADRTLKLFKVPAAAAASMRDASQSESASDGASSALKKGKLTLTSVSTTRAATIDTATPEEQKKSEGDATDGSNELKSPPKKVRLFADENVPTFFRRMSWAPDGSMLFVPTGLLPSKALGEGQTERGRQAHVVYGFLRGKFDRPSTVFPATSRPAIAVRCCPVLWTPAAGAAIALPYRVLIAVATLDAVLVYDTTQSYPLAVIANIHYEKLTDITWSPDGERLLCSSVDGYCSLIVFDKQELGSPLPITAAKQSLQDTIDTWVKKANPSLASAIPKPVAIPPAPPQQPSDQEEVAAASEKPATSDSAASAHAPPAGNTPVESSQSQPAEDQQGANKRRRIAPTLVTP